MLHYILIREIKHNDTTSVNQLIREGYLSSVTHSWWNLLVKEITFQLIIMAAAVMFIFLGVPLLYCVAAVPLVLFVMFVMVYASLLMKATEVTYQKRAMQSWVAEAYEPFFFSRPPKSCDYKMLSEEQMHSERVDLSRFRRKIIGTVSVTNHSQSGSTAWLFRLVVDAKYRRKGIGTSLVRTVEDYCKRKGFYEMQLAVSEHQDAARQLFTDLGFQMRLMYHKHLIGSALTLLMCHLEYDLKPDL